MDYVSEAKCLPKHEELISYQRKYKQQVKQESEPGTMIMHIDFVRYEFQQDKCKKVYVNDLVIVVEKLVEVGGERKWEHQYYDFLCSDISSGKNNFHYVKTALKWMVEHDLFGEVKQIILFSDNTGKDFKNYRTVEYLMYLAVSLNYVFCGLCMHLIMDGGCVIVMEVQAALFKHTWQKFLNWIELV